MSYSFEKNIIAAQDFEMGFWSYILDSEAENYYELIEYMGDECCYAFRKDMLFSYIFIFYLYSSELFDKSLEFTEEEIEYIEDNMGLFSPDESVPYNENKKLYKQLHEKVKPYYDEFISDLEENYKTLTFKDGTVIANIILS